MVILSAIRTDRLNPLNYVILQIIFQQLYILHTRHFKRRIVLVCIVKNPLFYRRGFFYELRLYQSSFKCFIFVISHQLCDLYLLQSHHRMPRMIVLSLCIFLLRQPILLCPVLFQSSCSLQLQLLLL